MALKSLKCLLQIKFRFIGRCILKGRKTSFGGILLISGMIFSAGGRSVDTMNAECFIYFRK